MCMVALKRHSTQTLLHVKQEIALQDAIAVGLAVPVVPEVQCDSFSAYSR